MSSSAGPIPGSLLARAARTQEAAVIYAWAPPCAIRPSAAKSSSATTYRKLLETIVLFLSLLLRLSPSAAAAAVIIAAAAKTVAATTAAAAVRSSGACLLDALLLLPLLLLLQQGEDPLELLCVSCCSSLNPSSNETAPKPELGITLQDLTSKSRESLRV
ncbi:hypothetical protein ACSSS7_002615 [Eimeria intestinalis]